MKVNTKLDHKEKIIKLDKEFSLQQRFKNIIDSLFKFKTISYA